MSTFDRAEDSVRQAFSRQAKPWRDARRELLVRVLGSRQGTRLQRLGQLIGGAFDESELRLELLQMSREGLARFGVWEEEDGSAELIVYLTARLGEVGEPAGREA